MVPAISLIVIVFLSVVITRVATIALVHTGLSKESAKFQSRSALSGAGFTTNESEKVVNHPVRRRIIMLLMLIGNAGLVTMMSSLILTFVVAETRNTMIISVAIIVLGISLIWWVGHSQSVDRLFSRVIAGALKRYTSLDIRDFSALLHLSNDYRIVELYVKEEDWIANRTIKELNLNEEGILVLGIQREKKNFIGAPSPLERILTDDVLTIYGTSASCEMLDERMKGPEGDNEHQEAVLRAKRADSSGSPALLVSEV